MSMPAERLLAQVEALRRIGPDAKSALPTILKYVETADPRVRAVYLGESRDG